MMKMLNAPSPHFNDRALPIDSIILHYTDMPGVEETLAWFRNPASQVSCHYLIDEKGQVYQLVDEDKRAWHAGQSFWKGCTDMNSCSIGIELANPGHSHGYLPFPQVQIEALIKLCQNLVKKWGISPSRVLGHSDVAPRRKQDPGHLFPWEILAREGLGLWPNQRETLNEEGLMQMLSEIGYETISPFHTLLAFQRHFQSHKVDGSADDETRLFIQRLWSQNDRR